MERRRHDIAVDPAGVEPADVVVLHRVVCCYPDYERLLGAAADHAAAPARVQPPAAQPGLARDRRRAEPRLPARWAGSSGRSRTRRAAMLGVLERRGLRQTFSHRGVPWLVAGLER